MIIAEYKKMLANYRSEKENGSMLVLASFIILLVSMLCVSYWILIRINTTMLILKEKNIQVYYAALGGIEDAISEIREGHPWGNYSQGFSQQWQHLSGNTYYKSSVYGSIPLSNFDYPVTISVTLDGDPMVSTVSIKSVSEINDNGKTYSKILEATVIRALSQEVHILNTKGLNQ
ncbi:MAG: hypothetical protein GY730_07555 [bacterium]|nr:hypothetical protein [bacterium]